MRALVFHQSQESSNVIFEEKPVKEVPDGYARVKVLAASLNHRDEWIRNGFYKLGDNYIMGSDVACGTVEEVKDEKYDNLVGKQVIIYPYLEWENDAHSSRHVLKILGGPDDGTFCEKIVVPAKNLMEKPDHLTPEQAATLPIAGLTSYQALIVRGGLKVGETVLITGSGGGCGLFLIQFAKAFGAKGVLYTEVDWSDKLKQIVPEEHGGFFDMIIDSSGGRFVSTYLDLLKSSGRYVFFGQ
ncbi:30409_t:CDS:2, partial [Racocetra persica]